MRIIKNFKNFTLENNVPVDDEQIERESDDDICIKCDCENPETCECPKCDCPECRSNRKYVRRDSVAYTGPRKKVMEDEVVESKKARFKQYPKTK